MMLSTKALGFFTVLAAAACGHQPLTATHTPNPILLGPTRALPAASAANGPVAPVVHAYDAALRGQGHSAGAARTAEFYSISSFSVMGSGGGNYQQTTETTVRASLDAVAAEVSSGSVQVGFSVESVVCETITIYALFALSSNESCAIVGTAHIPEPKAGPEAAPTAPQAVEVSR
jgi:hypothetical protein